MFNAWKDNEIKINQDNSAKGDRKFFHVIPINSKLGLNKIENQNTSFLISVNDQYIKEITSANNMLRNNKSDHVYVKKEGKEEVKIVAILSFKTFLQNNIRNRDLPPVVCMSSKLILLPY